MALSSVLSTAMNVRALFRKALVCSWRAGSTESLLDSSTGMAAFFRRDDLMLSLLDVLDDGFCVLFED
jgi:hypothetical protein